MPILVVQSRPVLIIGESHVVSNEPQVGPRYNLWYRATLSPADKFGFPLVNAVFSEPCTYQEASTIPEWQPSMTKELAALDHTGTWDVVPLPSHAVPTHLSGYLKLRPSQMIQLRDINHILLLEVLSRFKALIMMRHLLMLLI